jgi:predicted phage terminase large subunit-like protein
VSAPAFARSAWEDFGKFIAVTERGKERFKQSRYGYYDDDGIRQGGLIAFVRYFWSVLEPSRDLVDGWPIWAMCEHLEAVTEGKIRRLLMNVPPGFMKSMLTDVFWPAWEQYAMGLAHYRYVCFSYSQTLTVRDNGRFRDLVLSDKFRKLYPDIALRNQTVVKVMNNRTGWKLASSIGGVTVGERGDRVIIDDPHNIQQAESEIERANVTRWFLEAVPSRLNDLATGAIVIIMQRLHEDDVSGLALSKDLGYTHLMIPWEWEPNRACQNALEGWFDPREECEAGEPAWSDRFAVEDIDSLHRTLGPYAFAAQYQQSPQPRGGGIFKPEWWQLWDPDSGKFPPPDFVVASLDGAFTEKEENDPSGFTLWFAFTNDTGNKRVILVNAWRKHLEFSAPRQAQRPNEPYGAWKQRTQKDWGLMEWVHDSCISLFGKKIQLDRLLIEDKGPGHSAAQELANRYGLHDFGAIELVKTKGDKVARALAVQPNFSNGMIYAPEFTWSNEVIREMEVFPKGTYDDLTDSTTQAIRWFRDNGFLHTDDEQAAEERAAATHTVRKRHQPLYPV